MLESICLRVGGGIETEVSKVPRESSTEMVGLMFNEGIQVPKLES